ncbi:Rha family transcriptional regulator [Vogesella sp. AC12]|uniref:Rha family transcriptional regulator n=1 Tax=Vogesella sp. AC12 TaxID=2950550 RepID=UPI00210B2304|nr:Rha family transcriptional regulator [Vogesella sp. AC12]MCQ4143196.1 Rha family transcriptional regulator [Vogesella sp. AC12]
MAAQSLALSAPVVSISNGQTTTTSKAVADYFHKQHKDVLRKIETLSPDLPSDWYQRNFAPIQIEVDLGMGRKRVDPGFEITRDGFTLLAMGFTGKQALQWKLRYIEAFNAMEAHLNEQRALPADHVAIRKDRLEQLRQLLTDWKACSYRLYGPLSTLGVPDGVRLYTYAHELSLVWGIVTNTKLFNGQPHTEPAAPPFVP